ncbi:MAG: DUF4062 domain-containing protein [Chloroflexi bacterium]|nr:MAG: DUF4062 domain-containing protein [Chloroflexota bacterium]
MTTQLDVFISSKMQELADERKALQELLPKLGQDMLRMRAWVFEQTAPASEASIREVYLDALRNSALYIGLFWNEYGEWTIDEFERATEWGIDRHIYVKNVNPEQRDPRLEQFLAKQSDVRFGITPRWFTDVDDLKEQVRRSIERWLLDRQIAHHSATTAIIATMADDVPELPRKLVGREDVIDETLALLEDNDRVLLHGFGGTGKSAVAASIAAEWIDDGRGQVIWMKAGNAPADDLFEALGRAFGAQQQIAAVEGDARVQAVRHLLAENKGLLVLDDVWNGAALATMVKALPRRMPLLATSRQRYPLDEIIEVGQLKPDEALKLLGLHLRRRDFSDNAAAHQLCEMLGYHAFALEVASKTMKAYSLEPAELVQRIEDAPHDLVMPANFGELGRTSIKALLDASIDALDRNLYDVFVTFGGMFEPTVTPELLARTMHADDDRLADALADLDMRGLVSARSLKQIPYYQMHDLAYSYARTMFLNKGLGYDDAIAACREFAAAHAADLDLLDIEQSNLLEAAETAQQLGQPDAVMDIMRCLTVDGPYMAARGHTSRSLQLHHDAIDIALERGESEVAHYLLSRLGNNYASFAGDFATAFEIYERAYMLAEQMGDAHRQAILLTVMGTVRFRQGADDADDYHARAEAIARENDDDVALCQILEHRGGEAYMHPQQPDYERGRQFSDEAAAIAERLGAHQIRFFALINRGGCEQALGLAETALETHNTAYELAQAQDNHYWMAGALNAMGEDYHLLGDRDRAQQTLDAALSLWRRIGAKSEADKLIDYMERHEYDIKPE